MSNIKTLPAADLENQIKTFTDFSTELTPGVGAKTIMADLKAGSRDLWQVNPKDIVVLPGFNPRVQNRAYFEGVASLGADILKNGYYQDKPLSGYIAKIDGVDRIVLHDGHRRHGAVLWAIENGAPIKAVPMVMKERSDNMIQLTLGLLHSNEGQPFSVYEKAVLAKRLKGFGWENKEIATEFKCTTAFVGQLLTLAGAPQAIAELVQNGELSATQAHDLMKQHGEQAAEVATTAVAAAKAAGKKKVTAKDLTPKDIKSKNAKKVAYDLYFQLKKCRENPDIEKKLEDKQIEAIDALIAVVEKKPAAPKEPKAPAAKKAAPAKKAPAAKKAAPAKKAPAGGAEFFDKIAAEQAAKKAAREAKKTAKAA